METKEAIMGFSQSEKIKTLILWINHNLEISPALPEAEKKGADRLIRTNVHMLSNEIQLGERVAAGFNWGDVKKHVEKAIVMMNSGVEQDTSHHLTQALTHVTTIGQRSMTLLREKGLI